jgi:hypothetical protein
MPSCGGDVKIMSDDDASTFRPTLPTGGPWIWTTSGSPEEQDGRERLRGGLSREVRRALLVRRSSDRIGLYTLPVRTNHVERGSLRRVPPLTKYPDIQSKHQTMLFRSA